MRRWLVMIGLFSAALAWLGAAALPAGADEEGVLVAPPPEFEPLDGGTVCGSFEAGPNETAIYRMTSEPGTIEASACLILQAMDPLPISIQAQLAFQTSVFLSIDPEPVAAEPPVQGQVFEFGDPGNTFRTVTLVFASRRQVYTFHLIAPTATSTDTVIGILSAIARDQVDADDAKGASGAAAPQQRTDESDDPELASRIIDVSGTLGIELIGPLSMLYEPLELPPEKERLADVVNRRTRRADRVWSTDLELLASDGTMRTYLIAVERYPFERFAAAYIGLARDTSDGIATDLAADQLPADAVAFLVPNMDRPGRTIQIIFRSGRYVANVMVSSMLDVDPERDRQAATLARTQAAGLPADGSAEPYYFPSEPLGNLVTVGTASAIGLLLPLAGRALARSRLPSTVPVPSPAVGLVDARPGARRLRRRGRWIFVGQLVALDIAVLGFIGTFGGYWGWGLGLVGLGAGLALTSWAGRADGAVIRRATTLPAVLASGAAGAALVGGLSVAVGSLRDLAFGPSVTTMDRASSAGISPELFAGLKAVGGLVMLVVGAAVARLARARWRADATRLRAVDHRSPALYLRSFDDDVIRLPAGFTGRQPFSEILSLRGSSPFEEVIAWELSRHWPVTAVGDPEEGLASLGAAREHLPNATWLDGVVERMAEAALLVVTIGTGPGLALELAALVNGRHLERVVFLFPPRPRDDLALRWHFVAHHLQQAGAVVPPLPADPGAVLFATVGPTALTAVVSDRRDEAAYQAGLRVLLDSGPVIPSAPAFAAPGAGSSVDT